jgi:acyl-CoA hydrolase
MEARPYRIDVRADILAGQAEGGFQDEARSVARVQRRHHVWRKDSAGVTQTAREIREASDIGTADVSRAKSPRPVKSASDSGDSTAPNEKTTRSESRGTARPVHETQHETAQLMMPQHANVLGHVFGGVVLSMMDTTAAVSAIRHARLACVTVSVDRVDFREPIHVGDLVIMKSSVNYVGRTSMEIGVRVETENLLTGLRRHTNSCYLTFVAVDRNGRPVPVPPLKPETPEEIRRYEAARERRASRLKERIAEEARLKKP